LNRAAEQRQRGQGERAGIDFEMQSIISSCVLKQKENKMNACDNKRKHGEREKSGAMHASLPSRFVSLA
jgi:hypothetical protein